MTGAPNHRHNGSCQIGSLATIADMYPCAREPDDQPADAELQALALPTPARKRISGLLGNSGQKCRPWIDSPI